MFELLPLEPLNILDIEEKIQLNLKKGFDLQTLKDTLEAELFETERVLLTSQIQAQNLKEQIAYLDKRIAERVNPEIIEKVKQLIEEKEKLNTEENKNGSELSKQYKDFYD